MTKLLKAADNPTCLMLKLDTDMIMVGLLQISSGRTQREKMAFCLGDSASFPVLSLENKTKCFMEVVKSAAAVLSMQCIDSHPKSFTAVTSLSYLQMYRFCPSVAVSWQRGNVGQAVKLVLMVSSTGSNIGVYWTYSVVCKT